MIQFRKAALLAGAALAFAAASPSSADVVSAKAGLDAMSKLNLIVLDSTVTTQLSDDVEGKAFIAGGVSGNAPIGIGPSATGQGFVASNFATLTVGKTLNGNIQVNNGNGVAPVFRAEIGGNATGLQANPANGGSFQGLIGGAFNAQNFNPSAAKTVRYGTTISGAQPQDAPFFTQDTSLAAGGANDAAARIATLSAGFNTDFTNLSSALRDLTLASNPSTIGGTATTPILNAVKGSNGFALFNLTTSFFNVANPNQLTVTASGGAFPIIINVTGGGTVNWNFNNGTDVALIPQIIWNFTEATTINTNRLVRGSLLAPNATVTNTTPIEGSVVVKRFVQGGEVHLGTYGGGDGFITPVPEPSAWAMMIGGFGLIGAALRRRRALAAA